MSKKLPAFVLMTTLGAAATLAVVVPQLAQADEAKLNCETFKKDRVKAACKAGANTERAMRNQMKEWQKVAKSKGGEYKCTTCHEKSSGGPLNGDGASKWDEFEKLL